MGKEIAWLDCPYGNVNDPFPGQCELYLDTNSNQICDHSEPLPPLPASGGSGQASAIGGVEGMIIFLTLVVYFAHWYLVNKTKFSERFKWLSRASFRYFWNLVLLLSFIPAAVSGILWVFEIRSVTLSLWHYQAGLVFTIVATLHLLKRFQHFLRKP